LDEDRRAVERQRAGRQQDVVGRGEGVAVVFGILAGGATIADGGEVQRQAAVEDARATDVGVGGAEGQGAEAGLGQAAVRGVGRERGGGHEGRAVTAGDDDRRSGGVAGARIGHGDAGDLAGGLVEDGDRGRARAAPADEADERSADIAGAGAGQRDAADAGAGSAREDGLDADGEAVGVDGHAACVDRRGADAAIDEVILGGGGAEGAVVDVDEGDAVGAIGVDLVELGQTAVGDVEDRERARIVSRGVHEVELGSGAAEKLTGTADVQLELAIGHTCVVVGLVLVKVGQGEGTTRDVDE